MAIPLASFPNSRIKPRPATRVRDTFIIVAVASLVTEIIGANDNRTDVLVRNLSLTDSVWYGFDNAIDDQVGPQGGEELKAGETVSIDVGQAVYIFNPTGSNIEIGVDEGEG